MPDRWTLRTPTGDLQLNASFHAPKYQPGGVDTNAALRRDGRTTYQRSGDGLPTPGPLVLRGRVWNDARDIAALIDELEAIQEAVATCTSVVRTTSAGTYVYDGLSGGPTPEVTPDGLGGWQVEIELWPERAAATFVPSSGGPVEPDHYAIQGTPSVSIDTTSWQDGWEFQVGADPILLTALRLRTWTANKAFVVRLWRISDQALLMEETVTSAAAIDETSDAVLLDTPIELDANTNYALTMYPEGGGIWSTKFHASSSGWTIGPGITRVGRRANLSAPYTGFPTATNTGAGGVPDFGYVIP